MITSSHCKALFLTIVAAILVVPLGRWISVRWTTAPRTVTQGTLPSGVGSEKRKASSAETNPQPQSVSGGVVSEVVKAVKMQTVVAAHSHSIQFYAVLRDQHDQPVSGARLQVAVRKGIVVPPLSFDLKFTPHVLISDNQGRVELIGVTGDLISVNGVEKEGADLEIKGAISFDFDPGKLTPGQTLPTRENPAIIRVWVSRGREVLVVGEFGPTLYSGQPVFFDLIAQKSYTNWVPNADIKIVATSRSPVPVAPRGRDVQSLTIAALDGGVTEAEDGFLYEAKEEPYPREIFLDSPKANRTGSGAWELSFYFRTRGLFYGSATFIMDDYLSGRGPFCFPVTMRYRFAPSGSRILQPETNYDRIVAAGPIDRAELSRRTVRNRAR